MLSSLGLTVAREIPLEFLSSLASGAFRVHGGVIRNGLGQIVGHLATPAAASISSLIPGLGTLATAINTGQIYAVGRNVKELQGTVGTLLSATEANTALIQQVQQTIGTTLSVSMAGTALSGLGLVTSVAGFAYLSQRLNKIDAKLGQLEKQIKEIRHLIQSQQKAQLHAAIDCLRQAELTSNKKLRHELLMQSKSNFTTLTHYYRELWSNSSEIHEVDGVDEYFTLAFTGAALATSELGMAEIAFDELDRHFKDWKVIARKHCEVQMIRNDPERFLAPAFVKELPARELVETLDFVHDGQRGIEWIDDLRSRSSFRMPRPSLPGSWQPFGQDDEKPAIEFARRLLARSNVLATNVAQFAFLKDRKISASRFADEVKLALSEHGEAPICIYAA